VVVVGGGNRNVEEGKGSCWGYATLGRETQRGCLSIALILSPGICVEGTGDALFVFVGDVME
jgi:hypothetical protein